MCSFDWSLFLEFTKVLLSWPPVIAAIGVFVIIRFHAGLKSLLERITEATLVGKTIRAVPPVQQGRAETEIRAGTGATINAAMSATEAPDTMAAQVSVDP